MGEQKFVCRTWTAMLTMLKNLLLQDPGKRPRVLKACFWPQILLKK